MSALLLVTSTSYQVLIDGTALSISFGMELFLPPQRNWLNDLA